ncbi:MAG TPA: DUF3280 domain-containing protein [Povalibacter sp.]
MTLSSALIPRVWIWARAVGLAAVVLCSWSGQATAADAPIKIAIFPFELEDFSAATSPGSNAHLVQATDEAKLQLLKSGRYDVIDTTGADLGAAKEQGLRNCSGCEAAIARKLGADQALIGVVSKISNTEYVIKLQVSDARTGEIVARFTSDLLMGANYSWSRGVRSVLQNQMLTAQ